MEPLKNEIWKDLPNHEGHYKVSNLGRVASLNKGFTILKPKTWNSGYYGVGIWKNNKSTNRSIHSLVVETFIGFRSNRDMTIDHIDGNKFNNCLSNLQIMSSRLNTIKSKKELPKSGYIGVCWNSAQRKWQIRPKIKNNMVHVDYFDCPKIAADCYIEFWKFVSFFNTNMLLKEDIKHLAKSFQIIHRKKLKANEHIAKT